MQCPKCMQEVPDDQMEEHKAKCGAEEAKQEGGNEANPEGGSEGGSEEGSGEQKM